VAALVTLAAPSSGGAQPVFRTGVDLVNLGVTVVDRKGAPITDLGADDFEVREEGKPQKIDIFVRGTDRGESRPPLHIGLLFDTSRSMVEDVGFSRSAAIKFLKTVDWAEDITLVDFDTEVRVARFDQANFARLVERIRTRRPDGWTALYDAMGVYLDGAGDQNGQKILVLYTDGGDTRSSMTFGDALDSLKASDVTLYVIGFLQHQSSTTRNEQRLRLQQLAEATGGLSFFPMSIEQLDEMYEKVRADIDARYLLGYASNNSRQDGAWRSIEVKITRPDLKGAKVRVRNGYFAPYKGAG
jgi:Ca-activated chloride channel family protein